MSIYSRKSRIDLANQRKFCLQNCRARVPDHLSQFEQLRTSINESGQDVDLTLAKNKDNTMKDFLQSAHGKFADYRDENELNVLIIALDDVHSIQNWWHYLFENQGLFTKNPLVDPSTYSRVDTVFLTNLLFRHKHFASINRSAWSILDSLNFCLSNPHRQKYKASAAIALANQIPNHTDDLKDYTVPGDAPQHILEAVRVSCYVQQELEGRKRRYYFSVP